MSHKIEFTQNELDNIGNRLQTLIEKNGLLKKDFATLAEITPQTLSKIINGKYSNLSIRLIEKFSQILKTNVDYLLCKSDNPGNDDFFLSDAWYKRNSQYYYIAKVISYLSSLEYSFKELVCFDDTLFIRDNKTLTFSTYEESQKLLNYGFELKNSDYSFIKFECTEDTLIKKMKYTSAHISHYWEIEKQDTIVRLDEAHFLNIMYSFALLTQNFFNAAIYDLKQINVEPSDLERIIQSQNATHHAPSKEEDEQRLLHAIYGENIPENPKKEE